MLLVFKLGMKHSYVKTKFGIAFVPLGSRSMSLCHLKLENGFRTITIVRNEIL
jgi:hypothetical protein